MSERIERSSEEWKQSLSPEQYQVARCGGTERAFTGAYWNNKATGQYHCVCCDAPLFSSATKFESGTGWPSFWDGVSPEAITTKEDRSHGRSAWRSTALARRPPGARLPGWTRSHRSALLRQQRFVDFKPA